MPLAVALRIQTMTAETDETADSGHVGPIIFANETARGQLVNHGEVVTFRKSQRTTGKTWWRESRLGEKKGDVLVEEIGPVDPWHDNALGDYADLSGFGNSDDWRSAIYDLNGGTCDGYLYRATLIGGDDDE